MPPKVAVCDARQAGLVQGFMDAADRKDSSQRRDLEYPGACKLPPHASLPFGASRAAHHGVGNRSVWIVSYLVAGQNAGIRSATIRNRQPIVCTNHIHVEIHQPFSTDIGRIGSHSVSCVTNRTTKSLLAGV